jgi:DHA1 family bicyclomycin/chloramphenicol resistance-like MFS transporter
MVRGYAREVFHWPMILCSLQVGMTCSILYVFAAKAPFLVIDVLGIRPDVYGTFSFLPALGQATGLSLSIYCAHRLHQLQAMFIGVCALNLAIILFVLSFWFFGFSLLTFLLPVPLMFMGNSLVTSNATAYALVMSHKKSYASALVNSLGLCIASGGVCFSNTLNFQNHWMVPQFFGAAALLALMWWVVLYWRALKS